MQKSKIKSKYVFVTDFPCNETLYHALAFDKSECLFIGMPLNWRNRTIRWRKPLFYLGYFRTAFRVLCRSTEKDVIISWNFNIGIFTSILAHLLFKKRIIVSLNMIAHEKNGFLLKVKQLIYNWIFENPDFHFSVNQKMILEEYKQFYKIYEQRVFELHDCYGEYPTQQFSQGQRFVFCCGERRDWRTYVKTAELLPDIQFIGVAREKYFDTSLLRNKPENLEMLFDITEAEFYDYLSRSAIVCIPMMSNTTAGLIVMFQSAFLNKPIICTNTPALSSTAIDGDIVGAILLEKGDYKGYTKYIKELLDHEQEARELTEKMQIAIKRFSPYCFSEKLLEYVSLLKK